MTTMESDLDVVLGEIQDLGCLLGAWFFDVAKQDDGTVLFWQIEYSLLEEFSKLRASCALFGVGE